MDLFTKANTVHYVMVFLILLNLLDCEHPANIAGVKMTVPDNTCMLGISEDTELRYKKNCLTIFALTHFYLK